MKIEDVHAFYVFLADIGTSGIITIIIFVGLFAGYFTVTIIDKIFTKLQMWKKSFTILLVMLLAMIGVLYLKNDANDSKEELVIANTVKSYLIANNQKFKSFRGLADDIYLDPNDVCRTPENALKRKAILKRVIKDYPGEFITIDVDEPDPVGIELIDPNAIKEIDSALKKKQPYFESKIIYYITSTSKYKISYDLIKDSIDGDLYDPDVINIIIANSKELLIPQTKMATTNGVRDENYVILNTTLYQKLNPLFKMKKKL